MNMQCHKAENSDAVPRVPSVVAMPLSGVYSAVVAARNLAYDRLPALSRKLDRPVISVGGIRAGGTGKTPAALLVGRYVQEVCGCGVAFLSRGYGRRTGKQVIVEPNGKAEWRETGDEPCMLHRNLPGSWLGIGADRTAVARSLSRLMPEKSVFILDDGFQRRQTRRDLDIVCLSESVLRDRLMPAGDLREPLSELARADILFIIGTEERVSALREVEASLPVAEKTAVLLQYPHSWVEARTGETRTDPPYRAPVAVTGIARPGRFADMLRSLSVEPLRVHNFRDHYNFKKNDIAPLVHNIYSNGMVTTEKDAVRLLSPEFAFLRDIWYLKIGLRFADPSKESQILSDIKTFFS